MIQSIEPLQSQHLQEEPIGNKLLVVNTTWQQSKPMELYGLGDLIVMDD
jgi:hypothetical protein